MITTCTECQARYQLEDENIPRRAIRVRCPACSGVFSLDGTQAGSASVEQVSYEEPVAQAPAIPETPSDDFVVSNGFEDSFSANPVAGPPVEPTPEPEAAPAMETSGAPVAVLEKAETSTETPRRRRSKEEMLARALVSDILVYNRDQRDTALANGTLLEALGGEIKKSWELYKEKVTPEVANSTNHFREALNEILAEGDKVF